MMEWQNFTLFGSAAVALWTVGAAVQLRRTRAAFRIGSALFFCGTSVCALFIALLWLSIGRAPMRTMGETRLWYALFIALVVWVLHLHRRWRFLLPLGAVLATVFIAADIFRPELHSAALMPALRSAWFIPHVAVYMLAYAVLAVATGIAAVSYVRGRDLLAADRLVRIAAALLLLGMLSGAVWAQQAWGDYWSWDAKENWAAATWLFVLAYLHIRRQCPAARRAAVALIVAAFAAMQMTWYGVDALPAADKSMHTYTRSE